MPIVDLPGGESINFPDHMSDGEMLSNIYSQYPQYNPDLQKSTAESGLIGLGRGLTEFGQGVKQKGLGLGEMMGLVPRGTTDAYNNSVNQESNLYNNTPVGQSIPGKVGGFLGGTLPYAGLPIDGIGLLGGAGLGALGATAAYNPNFSPENPNLARDTLVNAGIGGAVGGALGGAAKLLTGTLGKGINTARGIAQSPETSSLIDYAESNKLPLYAQDVSGSPITQLMGKRLEDVPSGMTSARDSQAQAAGNAASSLVDDFKGAMQAAQYGGGDLNKIEAVAAQGGARAAKAQSLLNKIDTTSDEDFRQIGQNSGNVNMLLRQLTADHKYNLVENLAGEAGALVPTKTTNALTSTVKQLQNELMPDNATATQLQGILDNISTKPDISFQQMRQLRSQLGQIVKGYYQGNNALIGDAGVGNIQKVMNGINDDMESFAKERGGKLYTAWKDADSYYKNDLIPYKQSQIAKVLSNENPDKVFSTFISNGFETGKPQILYNAMDDKGRAAVRYGMVKSAYQNAYDEQLGKLSLPKFNSALQNQMGARDVFFKGPEREQLKGLLNYLKHIQGAGNAVGEKKAATGIRTVPLLVGGGLVATNPAAAAASLAAVQGLRLLFTSRAGTRFLSASAKLTPNSPGMDRALNRFLNGVSAEVGDKSTKANNP